MDTNGLLDVAKTQQGLTSDYKLAQALGITSARMSDVRKGRKPLDEAEIFMLADMARLDPHAAAAAVRRDKEKNPAKRAYWEKIAMQFAMAMVALSVCLLTIFPKPAAAKAVIDNLQIMRSLRGWIRRLLTVLSAALPTTIRGVNSYA